MRSLPVPHRMRPTQMQHAIKLSWFLSIKQTMSDVRIFKAENFFSLNVIRRLSDKKTVKADDGPKTKQVKVKKKDKAKKDDDNVKSREYNLIVSALDAPVRKEPPISEEEKARRHEIGRNYNIGRFRFHNQVHQDLTHKIHLKKHAINMLPRNSKIKDEALKDNDEPPPPWRRIPVWTAPLENFDASLYMMKDEDK
jgi:hypothetical protein